MYIPQGTANLFMNDELIVDSCSVGAQNGRLLIFHSPLREIVVWGTSKPHGLMPASVHWDAMLWPALEV